MSNLYYLSGDATAPITSGRAIIAHVTNDRGGWGAGFVRAISARWPGPERVYRASRHRLGDVDIVPVAPLLEVANLCAQHGYSRPGAPALRCDVLAACLAILADHAGDASVHVPRLGCGLAGGVWERVEAILRAELCGRDLDVFVYDLPSA